MANWCTTLDIKDAWVDCKMGKKTHLELAFIISGKLAHFHIPEAYDPTGELEATREDLSSSFLDLSKDNSASISDFDLEMDELYNWADTVITDGVPASPMGHILCWILTA
jgi:hypothetical protein